MDEIRSLLEMVDGQGFTCSEVHDLTVSHLTNVKEKLADLKRMELALKDMASKCNSGNVPDCPIIDTLFA